MFVCKEFRPDNDRVLLILIFALAIFILGVQLGIKHGRELQKEDICVEYGYCLPN